MNVAGLTIFLDIPVSTIVKRIAENHDRPLLKKQKFRKKDYPITRRKTSVLPSSTAHF